MSCLVLICDVNVLSFRQFVTFSSGGKYAVILTQPLFVASLEVELKCSTKSSSLLIAVVVRLVIG